MPYAGDSGDRALSQGKGDQLQAREGLAEKADPDQRCADGQHDREYPRLMGLVPA